MSLADWMAVATQPGPFSPPGMVVAINDAVTICGVDGAGRPLTADAMWPLACLTKLALADLAVRTLFLDAPITTWLPTVASDATVRELLTHTAGLPLDLPFDVYGSLDAQGVCRATLATTPTLPRGSVSYSNIGYGWIALALERATGRPLAELWAAYDLVSSADVVDAVVIADVRSPHAGTPLEPANSAYWRSLALPWCGAFGTIAAAQQLLVGLHPETRAHCVHAPGGFPAGAFFGFSPSTGCLWPDAAWGCGVEFRGTKKPHWVAPSLSADSYGHVGSSGILVWRDGDTTLVVAGPRTTDGGWMFRQGPKASTFAFTKTPQTQ